MNQKQAEKLLAKMENVLGNDLQIKNVFGREPFIFYQENDFEGTTLTMATSGLQSDYSQGLVIKDKELKLELFGAVDKESYKGFISSDWFYEIVYQIHKNKLEVSPGFLMKNPSETKSINRKIQGFVFIEPMYWEGLELTEIEQNYFTWLMPIPLMKKEVKFLEKNGLDKLEELLEMNEVNVFDFQRKSVI